MGVIAAVSISLSGAALAVVAVWWFRSEARTTYRRDRASLRRVRRRWSRVARRLSVLDRRRQAVPIRDLERSIRLAGQALRSRRRTTGLVSFVRTLREPRLARLDMPFERVYLIAAHRALDELAAPASRATVLDLARVDDGAPAGPEVVAESA